MNFRGSIKDVLELLFILPHQKRVFRTKSRPARAKSARPGGTQLSRCCLRARPGEIRPICPSGAKTVSSVLPKTVITFWFLSGIGHMTYRWKALETSYHLHFESSQNHLYIERYVHSKFALCPIWRFTSTQPHLHTHTPPWAAYHAIYPTLHVYLCKFQNVCKSSCTKMNYSLM